MNHRSKQFIPVIAASLSLLALPVLAQSSGSSGADSSQPSPSTSRSDRDQRPGSPDSTRSGSSSSSSGSMSDSSRSDSSLSRGSDINSRNQTGLQGNINFEQLDSDRDGRISQMEYTQSSSISQPGSTDRSSVSGSAGVGGVGRSSGSQAGQNSAETFRQLDTNHDGYLSRDELKAGHKNQNPGSSQPRP